MIKPHVEITDQEADDQLSKRRQTIHHIVELFKKHLPHALGLPQPQRRTTRVVANTRWRQLAYTQTRMSSVSLRYPVASNGLHGRPQWRRHRGW